MSPRLRITAVDLFERDVPFTHPFRFGAVTVEGATQAYVRVVAEVEGHGTAVGGSAELMVPKWFDKDPAKTPADTVDGLRRSLLLAASAYRGAAGTAFEIHAERHGVPAGGLPTLAAAFGPAELDKAVLDALFRAVGVGAWVGLAQNLPGINARLTLDLDDAEIAAFLARQRPAGHVAIRHAIGFLDDVAELPATLASTGCRFLKLKLSGDLAADRARLTAIAAVLPPTVEGRITPPLLLLPSGEGRDEGLGHALTGVTACSRAVASSGAAPALTPTLSHGEREKCNYSPVIEGISLDANEQYDPTLLPALHAMLDDPALAPIRARLLYVEQPLARGMLDLGPFGTAFPCVLDEGDDSYGAFPRALQAGWRGVSSKSCKGTYKALLNAIRAERAGAMMTAEDLTAQPGLALQQDVALAAFLGLPHMERNGHCYTAGFTDPDEAARFTAAHPELYDGARLRLRDGALPARAIGNAVGYGTATHPDWDALPPLRTPTPA